MSRPAPRTLDEYLRQLREALAGEDPALVQDALYDAEEYLRAEIAAQPGKPEGDVLELIASTYGAPDEVAAAYRETEAKVKAALRTPAAPADAGLLRWFFRVYSDPRAYTSLFYMLLTLVTGVVYFTVVVAGVSISAGLAILIVGVPFFLAFIGVTRVLSLGEGRLLEAVTGERMPRRPVHPGAAQGWWARIVGMLRDVRTWTTLAYFVLMLPLGVAYFVVAVIGLSVALSGVLAPFLALAGAAGWIQVPAVHVEPAWLVAPPGAIAAFVLGALLLTVLLHLARRLALAHVHVAKALLVRPGG